jgi:hypothetical protein
LTLSNLLLSLSQLLPLPSPPPTEKVSQLHVFFKQIQMKSLYLERIERCNETEREEGEEEREREKMVWRISVDAKTSSEGEERERESRGRREGVEGGY